MDTDNKIEVRDLAKSFGSVEALRSASLRARAGEITAIIGDNGAGKSTLIKCLSGVHTPDRGEILVDGEVVAFRNSQDARQQGVETIYQDLALADQLTVWQNVFLNRELRRQVGPLRLLRRREMRRQADELVGNLAVNVPSVDKMVRRLSGGQRQAVAIARGVMWARGLIIMDEPTAALGVQETGQVEALIKRVVAQGTTVIIVSHDFEQVMRLAQQVWVMRAGRVVAGRRTDEINGQDLVGLVTGTLAGAAARQD